MAYGDFDMNEYEEQEVKSDVNAQIEKWVEDRAYSTGFPGKDPFGVLSSSFNANAFQDESPDFSSSSWRDVLTTMASAAMKADIYEELRKLGWDERTGFPYEVR
jgi:hypothetical protein